MRILFSAPENAWGGFLHMAREALPGCRFDATGRFAIDSLAGYDVLIPTMCPVGAAQLATADRLKLIQQCGAGLEGVDAAAARAHGVWVANVPTALSGNADSVAELGIFFMIALARNWHGMVASLKTRRMGEPRGRALSGLTVGLVGLGGIAQALIQRLRPFGVKMIGVKRRDPAGARRRLGLDWVGGPQDLEGLLARSDFVVLCLPLTAKSQGLMNAAAFGAMRPGGFLINLSRGGLVERDALEAALAAGRLAGAGLDVFWEEPPDPADPLFGYNVVATPHIGGSTDVSMHGIVTGVVDNIRRIQAGRAPRNHL